VLWGAAWGVLAGARWSLEPAADVAAPRRDREAKRHWRHPRSGAVEASRLRSITKAGTDCKTARRADDGWLMSEHRAKASKSLDDGAQRCEKERGDKGAQKVAKERNRVSRSALARFWGEESPCVGCEVD